MQKITPCLWFDNDAEEAMNYYVSVFKNSKINRIDYYPDESLDEHFVGMSGKVINGHFTLDGNDFICLDGGPIFKLSEAVSFMIDCKDQEEVDYYWSKLSHVPESEQCGWCKDKFGMSWQIVPQRLGELLGSDDKEAVARVMPVFMEMHKIDLAMLEAAYAGK
ncbi:MAG TPA: VOC family protein [Candidatus Saccharibacteria bacterium]|nr:VOC family protein [Candidatus Saccharibacteria bacterium]